MRLGFILPHIGPWASPDALTRVATQAEAVGFDSLWVTDRSLVPLEPMTPYPLGDLPDVYKSVLDPIEALTFVAGQTSRVLLGTAVLNLPWYSPVLLSRRLATLDVLSNGRLRLGFGQGWSRDEYVAAGTPWENRGKRFEEALRALKTIWAPDPVEFEGEFYSIPRSFIGPKPVQKPHPPIYVGAYAAAALTRTARLADGWLTVGMPLPMTGEIFTSIQQQAAEAGRDPGELELIVRGNVELSDQPLSDDRAVFVGSADQIAADISAARTIGASELIMDATFDPSVHSVEDFLGRMELLFGLAN